MFDIECEDINNTAETLTTIGKYHFYTAAFEKANEIAITALIIKPTWLIIDEAGKLELEGKGFYPSIIQAIKVYDNVVYTAYLILTVRDSLCN